MIVPFGEAALLVDLPEPGTPIGFVDVLDGRPIDGVVAVIPGRSSVLVELDAAADPAVVRVELQERILSAGTRPSSGRLRTIPVVYGSQYGPDLGDVATRTGMSEQAVIESHASTELGVLFCGFAAGFAYLGDLPEELRVPRLATPRTRTPAGAVALAGSMSGIYPAELPGGWRVIGRTPIDLFDATRSPPAYLAPGDRVRWRPIAAADWDAHRGAPPDW